MLMYCDLWPKSSNIEQSTARDFVVVDTFGPCHFEETLTFSKGMSHVIHLTTQESKADGDLLSIIAAAVHNIHYCQYTH